jgi:hypothetical protein
MAGWVLRGNQDELLTQIDALQMGPSMAFYRADAAPPTP